MGYFLANFVSFVGTHPQRMLDTPPVTPLVAASSCIKNHSGPKGIETFVVRRHNERSEWSSIVPRFSLWCDHPCPPCYVSKSAASSKRNKFPVVITDAPKFVAPSFIQISPRDK
jgi:hypothetical protein